MKCLILFTVVIKLRDYQLHNIVRSRWQNFQDLREIPVHILEILIAPKTLPPCFQKPLRLQNLAAGISC